jgi:diguanylate cyclase (GGDEF)-like protein
MGFISKGSLVLRLWVTVSLLAVTFLVLSLGTYTWLAITDSVEAAHEQTQNKIRVIRTSRFSLPSNEPLPYELELANELGIRNLRLIAPNGREVGPTRFGAISPASAAEEKAFLATAGPEKPVQRRVRIDGDKYSGSEVTPADVVRGGLYGEQFAVVTPVPRVPGGALGGLITLTFLVQYPDVHADAIVIIKRSLWVGLVIVSGLLMGMWLLFRLFVTHPLRRLSQLALRIAGGDSVRMPAKGGDEMSELGRALNGMADALQYQATVDSLTGLYNLRHLSSNLEALIREAAETRQPLSVIVGDIDNLKPVNDTYGHSAGDKLLQAVSDTLRSWSGHRFTCWRIGGDEFAIALPHVDEQNALGHASDLRHKVSNIRLVGQELHTSISVGVASYPKDGENAGALLAAADRRMYALKALHAEERRLAAVAVPEMQSYAA